MKNKLLLFGILLFLFPATSAFSFETITPKDAYELVAKNTNVYLLDVRTTEEWKWVGHPGANTIGEGADLAGRVVNISYMIDCGDVVGDKPERNLDFEDDVFDEFDPNDDIIITMCREGIRGAFAAKILEDTYGYKVMNMEGAFEGEANKRGYRNVNGWVNKHLPYTYKGLGYQGGRCPEK